MAVLLGPPLLRSGRPPLGRGGRWLLLRMLSVAVFWMVAGAPLPARAAPPPPPEGLRPGTVARLPRAPLAPVRRGRATTTLTGRLFYEDHRVVARHRNRRDLDGRAARPRRQRADPRAAYLGAYSMVVDVYEQDRAPRPGCVPLEWVGAATVGPDGTFTVEVPGRDRCRAERDEDRRYVLRARTRYCGDELCYQVARARLRPYALWFGLDAPFRAPVDAREAALGDLLFTPAGRPARNDWARAANHYAALVDAVVALHIEGGIPFQRARYGPVTVRFPSVYADGRTPSAQLIDAANKGWPRGNLVMHEYGHIVHRRAWGGDYAGHHDPIQRWSGSRRTVEEPFIALKEGWANFVTAYVSGRCFRARYDTEAELASARRGIDGVHFPQNHHRLLCDWVDDEDDAEAGSGPGEQAHTDVLGLWRILDQTDDLTDRYPAHDPVREGLDVCDMMAAHIVQGAALGPAEVERRRAEARGLLATNDIGCPGLTGAE